jgi:hypothetical protein
MNQHNARAHTHTHISAHQTHNTTQAIKPKKEGTSLAEMQMPQNSSFLINYLPTLLQPQLATNYIETDPTKENITTA